MSGQFATQTSVPVEKTRAEIETILGKYGAEAFAYATEPGKAMVGFRLPDKTTGMVLMVRMVLPLPSREEERFTRGWKQSKWAFAPAHAVQSRWEQACRSSWRALLLVIKAKLEACEVGISTIEREFLADIVLPGGGTVGQWIRPQLPAAYSSGELPKMLPGGDV